MADDSDERRDQIDALLQELGPADPDRPAILTGWAVVTEWMDDTGDRWIAKAHSASLADWHARGLHHAAIFGDWEQSDDDEG